MMLNCFQDAWNDDDGRDVVEYALLLALILLIAASGLMALGTSARAAFTTIFKSVAGQLSSS